MNPKIKSFLLVLTSVTALPIAAPAAHASPIDWDCQFMAVRDVTDEQGQQTWIEATYSYFVGTAGTESFEVTCWLQTSAELGVGEVANTRHTCGAIGASSLVCANPVLFEIDETDILYFCTHVVWESRTTIHYPQAGEIIDNLLSDVFATSGVTTTGSATDFLAAVFLALSKFFSTPPDPTTTVTVSPSPRMETETRDYDDGRAGIQCDTVITT